MDELDRLYRRLVHNIRAMAPDLLGRPFEVSELYQQLVPYRTNRVALGFTANDEYELALCQLLAGSRGLLTGDAEMQNSMRRELDKPVPDLASYRVFSTSSVSLAPEPLRQLMLHPTPEQVGAVHRSSGPSPLAQASLAARATLAVDTPAESDAPTDGGRPTEGMPMAAGGAQMAAASLPMTPTADPMALASDPMTAGAVPIAAAAEATAPSVAPRSVSASSPAPPNHSMLVARPNPIHANPGDKCRYCGDKLPDGRSLIFCPGCGHNLTTKHCVACNTELEVEWKFCVTCGRESSA